MDPCHQNDCSEYMPALVHVRLQCDKGIGPCLLHTCQRGLHLSQQEGEGSIEMAQGFKGFY